MADAGDGSPFDGVGDVLADAEVLYKRRAPASRGDEAGATHLGARSRTAEAAQFEVTRGMGTPAASTWTVGGTPTFHPTLETGVGVLVAAAGAWLAGS